MTPEPWRSLSRPTYSAEWMECNECGKRYLVRLPPPSHRTLGDLERARLKSHLCRTPAQVQALRDYELMGHEEVEL